MRVSWVRKAECCRSSGTEPMERVMVESVSEDRAREIARAIADAIEKDLER